MPSAATLNGIPVTGMLHRKWGGYMTVLRFKTDPPEEIRAALFSKDRQEFTFTGSISRGGPAQTTVTLYCLGPEGRMTTGQFPRAYSFGDATFMAEWDRLQALAEKYIQPRDQP